MDCVLVGYNAPSVTAMMARLEKLRHVSGAYTATANTLLHFRGAWRTYLDMLNVVLSEATGTQHSLDDMEMASLGLCTLATHLTRRRFEVAIVNNFRKEERRLADLLAAGPLAVAISTTFYNDDSPIGEVVEFVRRHNRETTIVVGGNRVLKIAATADPSTRDYRLEKIGADVYVVSAHGQETLASLLTELQRGPLADFAGVPNLVYRSKGSFAETFRRAESYSLEDELIDWSLIPRESFVPAVCVRTSRGCAFSCSFCQQSTFRDRRTVLPVPNVERELRELHGAGVRYLHFADDSLNAEPARFKELLAMMVANRFEFRWTSYLRCDRVDAEACDLMRESGCVAVRLGLESGSQEILDAMNKRAAVAHMERGLSFLHERGIVTDAAFILGFPGERDETVAETVRFIERTRPTYYHLNVFNHHADTPIHDQAEQHGLKGLSYSWRHDTMDWRRACQLTSELYATIQHSTPTSYQVNSRSFPYLMSRGLSPEFLRGFLGLVQPVALLGDAPHHEHEEVMYRKLLALTRALFADRAPRGEHPWVT